MSNAPNSPWPDLESVRLWEDHRAEPRGADEYRALVAAQRLLQDRIAGAALPPDVLADVIEALDDLVGLLGEYQVDESRRWDGWRPDLPGRGHPLLPAYIVDEETDAMMRGRVTFTRFYLGGNGAVHGGVPPLLFDDLLGKVVNHHHADGVARTAFLKVNYRNIAPIGAELLFDATIDKVDGRKRWGSARLVNDGGDLLADAEGLFIKLRPGQP